MSMGGFAAMVRVTRSTTMVGFGDTGTFLNSVQMEMEGTLLECEYRDLSARLSRGIKTFVSVDLEFTENPDWAGHVDIYTDDGDRYLGTLQIRDRMHDGQSFSETDDAEVRAHINILLPITALHRLMLLTAYDCKLDTVHDFVDVHNRDATNDDQIQEQQRQQKAQKTDHVIAFVKRIYLEPVLESPVRG